MLLVDGPYGPACMWSLRSLWWLTPPCCWPTGDLTWYVLSFTQYQLGLTPGWASSKAPCSRALSRSWLFLEWPCIHYRKSSGQPFSMQSAIIMCVCQFVFLPVHCLFCTHCWMGFNQGQREGMGFRPRNPRIVTYWYYGGFSVGMHATGWHSGFIQRFSHMDSIFLQQHRLQPTSHNLEFRFNSLFFAVKEWHEIYDTANVLSQGARRLIFVI